MYSSPENHNDIPHGARESEEQYDFFDDFDVEKNPVRDESEAEEDPIKKFPLDFGEEAVFDTREPHVLEIYGNAQMTSATIHFDQNGTILDVSVRGPFTNEAQAREVFTSKATAILKQYAAEMGIS